MDLLTLDFESFYAQDYSLSNMTTESYVRDPRFEVILVGVKWDEQPAHWLMEESFRRLTGKIDWSDTTVLAHHAHFDGLILNHHYGKRPAFWLDTLAMARVVDGPNAGNSLEQLCERHGVGAKGDYLKHAKGRRLADFSLDELRAYGEYCVTDCEREYALAQIFLPQFPGDELRLIDITTRMFTEPVFRGNVPLLRRAVAAERGRKVDLLRRVSAVCGHCRGDAIMAGLLGEESCPQCNGTGVDKKTFSSADKFAALLVAEGVEPPTKASHTSPDKEIYAFARTDPGMQDLLEHRDERVRFLAEARIAVKSTILESRAARYAAMAERGPMPVYLAYAKAHTLRWAGGDKTNWQNMSNDNENRPELADLKRSIEAPEGHTIVAADSGQIEARVLAWLAQQLSLLEAFGQKRDIYSEFATMIYHRKVDRKNVKLDFVPGQLGKVSILGLGFGMGYLKFAGELLKGMLGAPPIQFTDEHMQNFGLTPDRFCGSPKRVAAVQEMVSRLEMTDRLLHCIVAESIVRLYRTQNTAIVAFWELMESVITAMINGTPMRFGGPKGAEVLSVEHERIRLPNGMSLHYPGLERDDYGQASYWNGRKRVRIHGPLLTENVVQCLARCIVAGQMLTIAELLKIALMTHDENVVVVPSNIAGETKRFMVQTMTTPPVWAPDLPLATDCYIGQNYQEMN